MTRFCRITENPSDPDLFQSDMRLTPMQRLLAETGGDVSQAHNLESETFASAKDSSIRWPRIVPYTITKELGMRIMKLINFYVVKYRNISSEILHH